MDGDGLNITDLLIDAGSTAAAFIGINDNGHAWHAVDGGVDARVEARNHLPQAAALAARANGE